jgi:hypothetical protein
MGDGAGREPMEPARSPRYGERWKLEDGWHSENVMDSAAFLAT